jgi:endonuclease/exonuclease/phosphatase family metal-dependent hydrolase
MALDRKMSALSALRPDIAVLQEVSSQDIARYPESCWIGNNPKKGMGVVGLNGFRVRRHPSWDPKIEFVVPIEVSGPQDFLFLGVWAMHNRALKRVDERPNRWQLLQALEVYESLLRSRPSVVAGDFNNAVRWDQPGKASNHSAAVQKLRNLGLVSAYHVSRAVAQGREPDPTLYWMWHQNSGYHIDYIWLPDTWAPAIKTVELGDYPTWVGGQLSDHVPLSVDVEDALIPPVGRRMTTNGGGQLKPDGLLIEDDD